MKRMIVIALLAMVMAACQKDGAKDNGGDFESPAPGAFTNMSVMGMYDANVNTLFAFDQVNDQMGYISSAFESRVQNSTPSLLFRCRLSGAPGGLGSTVDLTLDGKSVAAGSYTVEVVKQSGDYIWLWSTDSKVGFILFWPQ